MKIFVSSVKTEFPSERQLLMEQIRMLELLFVGMEYFGSNPESAREYDRLKVEDCDLFVGLIGREYGSVEPRSGNSYTELEYLTANAKGIPCLIYFKDRIKDDSELGAPSIDAPENPAPLDPRQARLRERMRRGPLVTAYTSLDDLRERFLVDLFRLSRGPLAPMVGYDRRHPIPYLPLRSICREGIHAQIEVVSQGKYRADLFIPRRVEYSIRELFDFDDEYRQAVSDIIAMLSQATQGATKTDALP